MNRCRPDSMQNSAISSKLLARLLEQFLADAPQAVAMEDGELLFEFATAKYSVSGEGKCILHLWSEERNAVRRVLDAELKGHTLRLSVVRFGQAQPRALEICANPDRRKGAAKHAARTQYQHLLERVLRREYPGMKVEHLSSSPDLEHSFSPVYTRAVLRAGQSAFAVLGVNAEETQSSVDAVLTFGILWMDYQRQQLAGRAHVEGLKLFLPPGRAEIVRQRAAHLHPEAAKWQLYELDERSEICAPLDFPDTGNIVTRLTHAVDAKGARAALRCLHCAHSCAGACGGDHGRVRLGNRVPALRPGICARPSDSGFRIVPQCRDDSLRHRLGGVCPRRKQRSAVSRTGAGHPRAAPTRRLAYQPVLPSGPERWLETLITREVRAIDERLDGRFVYSQVPAFAASDRAMLDVLTCTLDGRLAILELKANEDIHLPLQGLDYWARVRWHQQHGEFARHGYFAGRELSSAPPLLFLVAPALRVHPASDVLLRYLSPRIEWTLVQVDERWRNGVRVVNKKHAKANQSTR